MPWPNFLASRVPQFKLIKLSGTWAEGRGPSSWLKKNSGEWFRSTDLWVMSPARFHCATPLGLLLHVWVGYISRGRLGTAFSFPSRVNLTAFKTSLERHLGFNTIQSIFLLMI